MLNFRKNHKAIIHTLDDIAAPPVARKLLAGRGGSLRAGPVNPNFRLEALEPRLLLSAVDPYPDAAELEDPLLNVADTTENLQSASEDTPLLSQVASLEVAAPWGYSQWVYRRELTVDHTQVAGELSDYPLLVEFTDAALALHAQADGGDLLFTADDGATTLAFEIESYDAVTGHLVAWVRVPTISASEDTVVYLYYGNPAADGMDNPAAVWDANFLAVHHLEETTGTSLSDSTAAGNDGTAINGVNLDAEGMIDGGDAFDGVNDRTALPSVYSTESQFTFEAWVYADPKKGYVISQRNLASQGAFIQYHDTSQTFQLYIDGARVYANATPNEWHYVVATFDGATASLYVDNAPAQQVAGSITWPSLPTLLGNRDAGDRPFQGALDEVRLSDTARSPDYILTSYANQSSVETFLVVGVEEMNNPSEAPVISELSIPDGAIDVPLSLTELTFQLTDYQGDLMSYTVTTSPNIGQVSEVDFAGGLVIVPIAGLQSGQEYSWTIQASDGVNTTEETFTFTAAVSNWGFEEWRYRRKITIDTGKIPEDLTNFAVLVDITEPAFTTEMADGARDVVFTSSDGKTKLSHEIESFSDGHLVAWVNVPIVSSTDDTTVFMYYGNSDPDLEDQENPEAVWDSSYLAVHHLEESAGTVLDSTARNQDGTALNGLQQGEDGQINGAAEFDGIDDRVHLPQIFTSQTQFTIEGWVYAGDKQGYVISQRDTAGSGLLLQYYSPRSEFQLFVNGTKLTYSASMNQWHYVVVTFDGDTASLSVDDGTVAAAAATITWPNLDTYLGDRTVLFGRAFLGSLDEMRFSSMARSAAYIEATYANQSQPDTFYTVGERETVAAKLSVTNVSPVAGATDVPLNPMLHAQIKEIDREPINWEVQILRGSIWETIASGSDPDGDIILEIPTTGIDLYETAYSWRVLAEKIGDPTEQIIKTFSFTTRHAGQYAPWVLNPSPADNATAVALNPILEADVTDLDGDLMDITFSVYYGGAWQALRTYTTVSGGRYSADSTGWFSEPVTEYLWKVTASDPAGSGQTTETVFSLRTGGVLTEKWSTYVGTEGGIEHQIMPVMGDIDGDGDQEIVLASGDSVYAINGKTGEIEWVVSGDGRDTSVELADLDNDGTPEILYGMRGARIRALDGDGSILWTTKCSGEDQPVFPIIACDIDGDGFPTIYFATEDVTPTDFSGDMDDYTGAVTMLDHEGNILASTWVWHPCWGGMAIGDVNYDGVFELYVSDRRSGYNGMDAAQGLQAYNAHTLEMLWSLPNIQHSSPLPIIADVIGDDVLEVIATRITLRGPGVVDGLTGEILLDYFSERLSTHGVGTVYDIDGDGNLEIIYATSYPDSAPMDFVVFDLITGEVEFRPTFDYHATWPPKIGDVTGDGNMEILAAMGNQGSHDNYPLLIYNNEYELIDQVDISGAGQLTPARVYDCDGDGYNEVVLCGVLGKIMVFDTQAPTPDPAPRTWQQMYSEYRQGAPVYVEPPGPREPLIRDESIPTGQEDVSIRPLLSVRVHDFQQDPIDVMFEVGTFDGVNWNWQTVQQYFDESNGTFTADTTGFVEEGNMQYRWRVTAIDDEGHTAQKVFSFTTTAPAGWQLSDWMYRRELTVNHTQVAGSLTDFPLLVEIADPALSTHAQSDGGDFLFTAADGITTLAFEIESYDDATGHLIAWVKVPALSASQDTTLYLYYGNPEADGMDDPTAVWDADFLAVHHLEETLGTSLSDSTAAGNDGMAINGVELDADGVIDGGDAFDGVNDHVVLPQVMTDQSQFTFEAWVYADPQKGYVISQRNLVSQGAFIQYHDTSQTFQLYVNGSRVYAAAAPNEWHYVVATFNGSTARLYVDDSPAQQVAASITWPNLPTMLGDRDAGGRAFQGSLDEVRISDTARSAEYIQTSYANQSNPAAFLTVGEEEVGGSGDIETPIISAPSVSDGATDVPLSLAELTFQLTDNQGELMSYNVVTSPDVGEAAAVNFSGGLVTISLSALEDETTYTWTIEASDGVNVSYRQYNFTTAAILTLLDSQLEDSADSADLRYDTPGQRDWYESRNDDPSLLTLDQTNVGGNTSKKIKFTGSPWGNAYVSQEFGEPRNGRFTVQWDVYVDEINNLFSNPDRGAWMLIGTTATNGPNSSFSSQFVSMAFAKDGGGTTGTMDLVARQPDDGWTSFTTVTTGLLLDTWYTVKVDVDIQAGTYDVYVNDAYQATLEAYSPLPYVTHISFTTWNDGAATAYFDNVYDEIISD